VSLPGVFDPRQHGTYQDHNFAANYAWMRGALDSGRMTFGIVYTYVEQMGTSLTRDGSAGRPVCPSCGGVLPRRFSSSVRPALVRKPKRRLGDQLPNRSSCWRVDPASGW